MKIAFLITLTRWVFANKEKAQELLTTIMAIVPQIEAIIQKLKELSGSFPSTDGVMQSLSADEQGDMVVQFVEKELVAAGFTGERLAKLMEKLGPFFIKFILPILLKEVGGGVIPGLSARIEALEAKLVDDGAKTTLDTCTEAVPTKVEEKKPTQHKHK